MRIDIIRRVKAGNYSVVDNTIYRDKRVSLKARGLWSTVMGLPPNWDFSVTGMASILPNGRDSVYACLDDLAETGYVQKVVVRNKRGQFKGYRYIFHETPYREKPDTAKPDTENPTQSNTNPNQVHNDVSHAHTQEPAPTHEDEDTDAMIEQWAFGVEDILTPQPSLLPNLRPKKRPTLAVDPIPAVAHAIVYRICYRADTESEILTLNSGQRGRVASVLGNLRDAGADLAKLQQFEDWWVNNWRSRDKQTKQYQPPRPEQVQEFWVEAMKSEQKPVDEKVRDNKPTGPTLDINSIMSKRAETRGTANGS